MRPGCYVLNVETRPQESDTRNEPVTSDYRGGQLAEDDKIIIRADKKDFESLNLRARILSLPLPHRYANQGVAAPTVLCREMAAALAVRMHEQHRIFPERIAANVEEGITLLYRNHLTDRALIVEVHNTTEIAALVNEAKNIVKSEDIKSADDPVLQQLVELSTEVHLPAAP